MIDPQTQPDDPAPVGANHHPAPIVRARLALVAELSDAIVDEEEAITSIEVVGLSRHLSDLPALERTVLRWRFGVRGGSITRAEAATRLGLSLREVRAAEQRGIGLLRLAYAAQEAA